MSLGTLAAPPASRGTEPASSVSGQYLTFALDARSYAIPLAEVAEITPNLPMNRMPHMPKSVEGLLNLRGLVIPVINLRVRLGLPAQDLALFKNILILEHGGHKIGLLVDRVESVFNALGEHLATASPLLAGIEGQWVNAFLLLEQRVIAVLDTRAVTTFGHARAREIGGKDFHDVEARLDDSLKHLIELAPRKTETDATRILPQMEAAISHTEEEMAKVMERIEGMLKFSDQAFSGLARLKQEATLGRFKGREAAIAEIDKVGQQLQDEVFALMQQIQYQDIVRQKLERVLKHIQGLQLIVGSKFRDVHK